jgi:cardiolipin synthase A/B
MTYPLRRNRITTIEEPLPPCWLRRRETRPDQNEQPGAGLYRAGPQQALRRELLATIRDAGAVLLVSSFLLADQQIASALLQASERKVRVYVLTASEHRVAGLPREDDSFGERMIEEHKQLLGRLYGRVLLRSSESFHAKMLVADPGAFARGWLSTANFNPALSEARALAGWFSLVFWTEAQHELADKGRLAKVGQAPGVPPIPQEPNVVVTAGEHRTLGAECLRLVTQAREELLVSSYGLEAAHPVVQALVAQARAGVPVTVFTRPRPAVREAVELLASAGARILGHDKLHAKAIVSDAGALVMTANLETIGLESGFELGVLPRGEMRSALHRTLLEWGARFPWEFSLSASRQAHLGEICLADHGIKDGCRQVVEEVSVQLQPVEATDALRLDEAPEPLQKIPVLGVFPRRVRFEWEVRPPRLPPEAAEPT